MHMPHNNAQQINALFSVGLFFILNISNNLSFVAFAVHMCVKICLNILSLSIALHKQ